MSDITVDERFGSRASDLGQQQSTTRLFSILGSDDENEVAGALMAALEESFESAGGTMRLDTYSIEPIADLIWIGRANYKLIVNDGGDQPDKPRTDFEIGGGTTKILVSKEVVSKYAVTGDAPDCDGSIGATADGVEGCEIYTPSANFSERWSFPPGTVDDSYKATLYALCASPVNDDTFRNNPAGSVLFMGASGAQVGSFITEVTFKFCFQPNVTDLTMGGIGGIAKAGWDYLDPIFEEKVNDANKLVKAVKYVYVHRVYDRGDFSVLNIGS